MRLGGIVDMSTIDWYGNVSLVVFLAGCNFSCPYCQNSNLIPLDSGSEVEADYLRRRIEIGKDLLDSVVLTGGEPSLQPDGVRQAAEIAKELGLKVMLDTNGSRPGVLEALLGRQLIDRVALDIKAPLNPESYSIFAGEMGGEVSMKVRKSLELCNNHGVVVEARTTVAPGVSDDPEYIRAISTEVKDRCDVYYLQQFDNMGDVLNPELKAMDPPEREGLVKLAEIATSVGVERVYIKTRGSGLERVS
ncbi:MAG: anaerobic ribonucleoside-triphosphate reductase activating protein [Candidatus Bathyarchaeota archaeon]